MADIVWAHITVQGNLKDHLGNLARDVLRNKGSYSLFVIISGTVWAHCGSPVARSKGGRVRHTMDNLRGVFVRSSGD